jgi:hypothetical protein
VSGSTLITVVGSGFVARPEAQVAFNSTASVVSVAATVLSSTHLRVVSPAYSSATLTALSLALNGQQYFVPAVDVTFTFYGMCAWS